MVPSLNPVFLDLSDGSIIGEPIPALAGQTLPGMGGPGSGGSRKVRATGSDTPLGTTGQQAVRGQTQSPARRRGN